MSQEDFAMNLPNQDCQTIRAAAGTFLDGRPSRSTRERIRAHLGDCEPCMAEYRSLRRLSRLAARQPQVAAPDDLADRVRHVLHQRRDEVLARLDTPARSAPMWTRVAAAVALLPSAAFVGYLLGKGDPGAGAPTGIPVAEAPASPAPLAQTTGRSVPAETATPAAREPVARRGLRPVAHDAYAPYREAGFDPVLFTRAGRQLANSLILDHQDPDFDASLIGSEMEYFDLVEQARRFQAVDRRVRSDAVPSSVRELVRLVSQLDEAGPFLRERPDVLDAGRRKWKATTLLTSLPYIEPEADSPEPNEGLLRSVVELHAPTLDSERRHSLVRLLKLKHNVVHGRMQEVVLSVLDERLARATCEFPADVLGDPHAEDAFCVVMATALPEFGLNELANPYRDNVVGQVVPANVFFTLQRGTAARVRAPQRSLPVLMHEVMQVFRQKGMVPPPQGAGQTIQLAEDGVMLHLGSRGVIDLDGMRLEFDWEQFGDSETETWAETEIQVIESVDGSVRTRRWTQKSDGER